jgi:hypothetical protein
MSDINITPPERRDIQEVLEMPHQRQQRIRGNLLIGRQAARPLIAQFQVVTNQQIQARMTLEENRRQIDNRLVI